MEQPEKAKRHRALRERELQAAARKQGGLALQTLEKIMEGDGQDSVRLAAAREILDRGYGRTKPGGAEGKSNGSPYTVVVQRFTDAPDPRLEDFD